jgi:uncharacterized protein
MYIRLMGYRRRVIDNVLDELHPQLPAIVLQGPKAVGKTETAGRRAQSTLRMDQAESRALLKTISDDFSGFAKPLFIDEWQQYPQSWDLIRRAVDHDNSGGQFLLAGSAMPREWPVHSGAGRITPVRLRPLSLSERELGEHPRVSLAALLRGGEPDGLGSRCAVTPGDYADCIVRSGFPGFQRLKVAAAGFAVEGYLENVVQREFPEQGLVVRRPETLRAWLRAYAAATATTSSYTTILAAATPGQKDKPARNTVTAYRDVLEQLWLLDEVPAWVPSNNLFKRLASTPKHFLADPGLAAALLNRNAQDLLTRADGGMAATSLFGALFEHLVALSVKVYADVMSARVYHFRERDGGREIDLIVEKGDQVVAIEVKSAREIDSDDVRQLTWFRKQMGSHLAAAVVVSTGSLCYRRDDGILVIPAAMLGP